MGIRIHRWQVGLILTALVCAAVPAAQAGEFYVAGGLSLSGGFADAEGDIRTGTTVNGVNDPDGDEDSSPVISGSFGFEFPMHQILPRRFRLPRWMPDVDLEDWGVRAELELAGGRAYDLLIRNPAGTHITQISNLTLMVNAFLDLPLGHALEAMMGRSRRLEPLLFSPGVGIGYGRTSVISNTNFILSNENYNDFTWQVAAELGYPLTDNVVLVGGYRYVGVGSFDNSLRDSLGTPRGSLRLDVDGHEFHTAVRFRFWSIRFPRGLFDSKRPRYEP